MIDDQLSVLDDGVPVVLTVPCAPDGDGWAEIETALMGAYDRERGVFILPFKDLPTAEEVLRIMIGIVKREGGF